MNAAFAFCRRITGYRVYWAAPAELHVTAKIRVLAAKTVAPAEAMAAKARFRVAEPIRVAAAAKVVRCATEPTRVAAAVIRGALTAGATAEDRTGEAIRCAMGDPLPGSSRGLALNAANPWNRAKAHCARFRAGCASAPESARRFDIRFRAADGRGEQSARPERESAARSLCRRFASEQFDPVKPRPGFHGSAIRRDSDESRFRRLRFCSALLTDQNSEPGGVR